LINSSAGKPVSFEHHECVEEFSGVNLTVVFTVLGGGWLLRLSDFEVRKAFSTNGPDHLRLVPQKN
jgi:hypothetical protein